jgi:hypothetical protein
MRVPLFFAVAIYGVPFSWGRTVRGLTDVNGGTPKFALAEYALLLSDAAPQSLLALAPGTVMLAYLRPPHSLQ